MQESKEMGPHVTTKEELDALYKNIDTWIPQNEENNDLSDNQEE